MEAGTVVIEALDAERARIGREIHDGPAQALANAIFEVDDIERSLTTDPADALQGLRHLRALLRRELTSVREFISVSGSRRLNRSTRCVFLSPV